MTTLHAFIGPAGSGKTYSLKEKLGELCVAQEFGEYQSVLAITFMHGSRRRLAARLGSHVGKGIPVKCETIDSFCLRLVNRYRRYVARDKAIAISQDELGWIEDDRNWRTGFATIRSTMVSLLDIPEVRQSVAAAYPIVLIDEFQDCHDDLLRIVQSLSQSSIVLVGADDFQCFHSADESPAVQWVRSADSQIVELAGNHRTNSDALLETALALRSNVAPKLSIDVIPIPAHGLVAWEIASRIAWGKLKGGTSRVLISPAGPDASVWVKGILGSLSKELGKKKKVGPVPFIWEDSDNEKCGSAQAAADELVDGEDNYSALALQHLKEYKDPILRLAASRASHLVSIRGTDSMSRSEFHQLVQLAAHSISAFRCERQSARMAMTVHGAKNREFDYVFITWPFSVPSDPLQKRKLLYNAVTRAKLGATIFVQGDEKRVRDDDVLQLLESGLVVRTGKKKTAKKASS